MLFKAHNLLGAIAALLVGFMVLTGWAPASAPRGKVPESVRANPGSYRPVYIPTYRGGSSGGGSGGGWSGGK
ncbi:MAG: hypothetical protein V4850_28560 [Myxococcota bacterium]